MFGKSTALQINISWIFVSTGQQDVGLKTKSGPFRLIVWFVGFLTSSSTIRLYRGRVPRLTSGNFTCCHMRDRSGWLWLVSAGHFILTPTQPVGSGRPQQELNPGPPHQESRALPTELPPISIDCFSFRAASMRFSQRISYLNNH